MDHPLMPTTTNDIKCGMSVIFNWILKDPTTIFFAFTRRILLFVALRIDRMVHGIGHNEVLNISSYFIRFC